VRGAAGPERDGVVGRNRQENKAAPKAPAPGAHDRDLVRRLGSCAPGAEVSV